MDNTDTIQDAPEVDEEQQPGPGPQQPPLKDTDKQKLVQIITKMESAGESEDNIRAVVKRYQQISSAPTPSATPVDKGLRQTDQELHQPLQFNGTFKPDLEGEKNGLYLNDPEYQKNKKDFKQRILADDKGTLLYPQKDDKTGSWYNYYTGKPIPDFNPKDMQGAILQVPDGHLDRTAGKKFISPVFNPKTGSYDFPNIEKPEAPPIETLPEATVYGKKGTPSEVSYSGPTKTMVDESDKTGGDFRGVLKAHPELDKQIGETLNKYGPEYSKSLLTGSGAMANVLQKTVEDHYDLNKPLPSNVQPDILNGHLNVLNNFDKNRQEFETSQRDLQTQADLLTDRAKRTGQPVSPEDAERLAKKSSNNIQKWNDYSRAVKFAQNFVNQPQVKDYLTEFQKKQKGIQLIDEIRQRSFPGETNAQIKQDEYDRKAIEGNLNVGDYVKTFLGKAGSGLVNIAESAIKFNNPGNIPVETAIEGLNNSAQRFLSSNLPAISPEAIEQISKGKGGLSLLANDMSSTLGGFAPYIIPGMAGEGTVSKAATFATAMAESLPTVRKEAEKQGLTGSAYNTYVAAKPLVTAAFMTMLPNAKFAKGFDSDLSKAIVEGEFSNPKRALLNLAEKVVTPHPGDIAHLQAMLSGTAMGEALVNKLTNTLQAKDDIDRGISRKEGLPVEMSNIFNPRQTAIMALAGKVLEAVPTLKNSIGDLKSGKEVQETYDHIQNNMVELAGNNLEAVSNKINELVKKDPGNVYAQHLKNTIEDFAHAETKMPEGLEPEQKAALFSVQKQIEEKQRQMSYADPVYQPHLQKNIDELNKQIPEILKDPKKANDYLKDSHNNLTESILSPKIEEDEKANGTQTQTEGQVSEKPTEDVAANEAVSGAASSFLESRHADTKDDELGKVSGPNDNPLSKDGKKDANDLAREVEDKGVTKIITSDLERGKQTGNIVSEKTGATVEHRPELNTWDIGDFDKSPDSEFKKAQKYFVKNPDATEFEEKKIKESFNQYKDRVIKARTELENEPASTLVVNHSNNMMLWDAYVKNGHQWNEQAEKDYLSAKAPEPATLTNKTQVNATKIEEPRAVDVGQQAGDGEAMGEGNAEQGEPAGESATAPTKENEIKSEEKVDEDWPFIEEESDNEFTSTKNAIAKEKIEEAGLQHPMKEAARDFGTVWKDAQHKLSKGFDIEHLIKTLGNKPRAVTDLENAMILFHQNVREAQLSEANKDIVDAIEKKNPEDLSDATDRRAKLLDDLQDIYNVDKKIGRETARGLNARKMMADRRFSLINMQLEKRAAVGGEPLTEDQTAEIKKQYEEIKSTKEAYEARIEELTKENSRLAAEKVITEGKKTGRSKKTKEQFKNERKDIIQQMRADLLKAAKGGEGLTSSIPFAAQLKAAAPHIAELVKSFINEGVDKLEDITKNIYDILKPSIPDIEERHVHDLIAGVYNSPKEEKTDLTEDQKDKKAKSEKYQNVKEQANAQKYRVSDPKLMKLQANYERAKEKYEQGLKVDQKKSRTGLQKTQDAFLKYERFAKLSNPITLGKLTMAAITRLATTPVESAVGGVYSKLLPGIAKKAPGEAGINVSALAKGYKETFMHGLDDAATVAKGGKTDIEAVFGKKGHEAPEAIDFFGQLHSAIKAPVKRFAFARSFQKRIANNIKNGVTIDGMTEARIAMEAYKDAERSIFMQDNPISKGWSNAMNAMEKSGDTGKLVSTIGQWLVPFVKVPTNILAETVSNVAGPEIALAKIISTSLGKGLKNLSQEEAESIMRHLKKGTIGHVALMAGYLNPQALGGYYQKGEKRDKEDVKVGGARIDGVDIPAWALEAPIFQAMQIGSTIRRIKDTMVKGQEKGLGEGIWGGALGLMSHEPLLDEPARIMEAFGSAKERGYFIGELAKSTLVPSMLEYVAKATDPLDEQSTFRKIIEPENKRQPETIGEHIQNAIPGLRENVGEKKPPQKGHRQFRPRS